MITIKTYRTPLEADYAHSLLKSRGIQAFLHGEFALQDALADGIRLQVAEEDVATALRLLDHPDDAIPLPDDFEVPALQPGQEPGDAVKEC